MSQLLRLARSSIPAWMVEVVRSGLETLDPFVNLAYSQDGEDMLLRRLFEGQRVGFYVDVGAHHPYRFSNTCYFHRRGWRGINVDPNPDAIRVFDRYRPGDTNVCVGIADAPGTLEYHFFNESALNTFDAALAKKRAQMPGYRLVETRSVPVRTLDELLTEYLPKDQRIDFLTVDVEGLDLAVLRSGNWDRFRPQILLVESRERTFRTIDQDPISAFAASAGYQLVAKTLNTLIFEDAARSPELREAF